VHHVLRFAGILRAVLLIRLLMGARAVWGAPRFGVLFLATPVFVEPIAASQ
jgi:hypothetical protein